MTGSYLAHLARFLAAFALLVSLVSGWPKPGEARQRPADYFVLSLSWSPTYCRSRNGQRDHAQCSGERRFAFVVHGLWPQYHRGWPKYCKTDAHWVPNWQINAMLDIMPSRRLIIHEWKKHGTCAGVSQRRYFQMTRALYEKILTPARYVAPSRPLLVTPEILVNDFLKTNNKLFREAVSVQCGNSRDRARLSELRICFDLYGDFTACGQNEARSCRARTLVLPPVR